MRERLIKAIKIIAPIFVSGILLALLASRLDIQHTIDTIRSIDLKYLVIAVFFVTLYFSTSGIRFSWLARPILKITYVHSIALNFFVVLSAHGLGILSDALRVIYINKKHHIPLKTSIALNFADRFLSLWLLGICLLILTPFFLPLYWGASLLFAGIIGIWLTYKILRFPSWPSWIKPIFKIFHDSVNSTRLFFSQFLLSLLSVIFIACAFYALAHAMQIALGFGVLLLLSPIALFASVIPFTYMGLGTREAAVILVIPILSSIKHEQALALSLMLGACFLLSSLIGGTISSIILGKSIFASLRKPIQ